MIIGVVEEQMESIVEHLTFSISPSGSAVEADFIKPVVLILVAAYWFVVIAVIIGHYWKSAAVEAIVASYLVAYSVAALVSADSSVASSTIDTS